MQIKNLKYQVAIVFVLGVFIYYLTYRIRYTINPDALILSISFYCADVFGFLSLFFLFFQLWNPTERKAPPPPLGLSVDVYIPTYNESISIIKKTVLGCTGMRYPHKTYILDDGNRPELAQKAAEWGCEYIVRVNGQHAKAGNLNNALSLTKGDFVVVFDADCVPTSDFLDRTLGVFQDQKMAFVQTPHNYYNTDSFLFTVKPKKERLWNTQDLFYRIIMPGRDYWNASFFAGTAAVFRKKALTDVGGFATGSITEDFHTSMNFYSHGWNGSYVNEILSNELAPEDVKNYHIQLRRWAEGNISMLYTCNPLFKKGLSFAQRICFFSTIFGWFFGFPKLVYLAIPPAAILFGMLPIKSFDFEFIWRCSFFLVVLVLGFEFITRWYGKIIYCEFFTTINFFAVIQAAFRSIFRFKSTYKVTSKDIITPTRFFHILPQIVVYLLSLAGIIWAGSKIYYYGISVGMTGTIAAIFWNGINGTFAFIAIERMTRPYYKRKEFRFVGAAPVRYSVDDSVHSSEGMGITRDISENGISLVTFTSLPKNKKISLSLYLNQTVFHCKATVLFTTRKKHIYGKMFTNGLKYEDLSEEDTTIIRQYCFNTILPKFQYKFSRKYPVILKKFLKCFSKESFRKHYRPRISLPLVVRNNEKTSITTTTNDISVGGLSFTSYMPMELGTVLTIEVSTPTGTLVAKGDIVQMKKIVEGNFYFISIKFVQFYNHSEESFFKLTGQEK